jgi:Bacterial regulatory proteins, luxR family
LQLLAEGKRCKAVAVLLNITVKTAETHRKNLMSKLNIHSTAKLVVYAVRNEIIRVQFPIVPGLPDRENRSNVTAQSAN